MKKVMLCLILGFYLVTILSGCGGNGNNGGNGGGGVPSVNSVSGEVRQGNMITISGVNFGQKTKAAPIKFDDFENGTSGISLSVKDPSWVNYWGSGTFYSNGFFHSGKLSVGSHITDGESFRSNYYTYSPASSEMFISYWWRTANADTSDNTVIKMTRINSSSAAGGGGVYNGPGNTTLGGTYNLALNGGPYCAYNDGVTNEVVLKHLTHPPMNTWFRVDMYKKLSTPGVHDGIMEVKLYGIDSASDLAAMTRAAGKSFLLDTVLLGTMDGNAGSHDYEIYIDDMYIDNTRARVEICDSATWDARMQSEVQPATAWSDTSITVTVNQGAIPNGASRYLYVIDSSGRVNANGYPITF